MSALSEFPFDQFKFNSDSIFKELPKEELDRLNAHTKTRLYKKKQVIFYEDSPAIGIYYIERGMVKKYKTGQDGKEQIFHISKSEDLIGYHGILSDENYHDSAATLEDSAISFIPKEAFLEVLDRSPKLSRLLLKTISHEFEVLINNLTVISQMSVRERVALYLLLLKEKFKDKQAVEDKKTEIKMSREDLASMVGTAKETLVRFLHEFKEEGIIEAHGKSIILSDVAALVKISNFRF